MFAFNNYTIPNIFLFIQKCIHLDFTIKNKDIESKIYLSFQTIH